MYPKTPPNVRCWRRSSQKRKDESADWTLHCTGHAILRVSSRHCLPVGKLARSAALTLQYTYCCKRIPAEAQLCREHATARQLAATLVMIPKLPASDLRCAVACRQSKALLTPCSWCHGRHAAGGRRTWSLEVSVSRPPSQAGPDGSSCASRPPAPVRCPGLNGAGAKPPKACTTQGTNHRKGPGANDQRRVPRHSFLYSSRLHRASKTAWAVLKPR